jgi:hypothetical protein
VACCCEQGNEPEGFIIGRKLLMEDSAPWSYILGLSVLEVYVIEITFI